MNTQNPPPITNHQFSILNSQSSLTHAEHLLALERNLNCALDRLITARHFANTLGGDGYVITKIDSAARELKLAFAYLASRAAESPQSPIPNAA